MKQSLRKSLNYCGLPIFQLEVMGKMHWFIADTGSNVNLISSEFRSELLNCLTSVGTLSTLGVGGDSENDMYELQYSIDGMTFSALFGALDGTFQTFEAEYGIKVSGLLGTEFMMRHHVIVDFSDGMIYICGRIDEGIEDIKQSA